MKIKLSGFTKNNKQRYFCKDCKKSFTYRVSSRKEKRKFAWFKQWVEEGYSVRELTLLKRSSQSTVRRVIKYWLSKTPKLSSDLSSVEYIICDGTFLKRTNGIYAVMNAKNHQLVRASYGIKEGVKDLLPFYLELKENGLNPISATVDGNPQQIKYLQKVWPLVKIQRCVVHVQRQGLSWCRRNPKRTDAKHLRVLLLHLTEVGTKQEARKFIKAVYAWDKRFGAGIESSPNRGKVFSDIIRARSMLLKALPNLFHYLDDPNIVRSTNALEGYFSRLKEHYRLHRGLSIKNRFNYFSWYFFLIHK